MVSTFRENPSPARLVSPGAILKRELEARGWSQADLAAIMNRPVQAISEIVSGTKKITPETAIGLSRAFGTSAEFWTNLESRYRLRQAEQKASPSDSIERRARLYGLAPVAELIRRGWIRKAASLEDLEKAVCEFLGIRNIGEQPRLAANFRKSRARQPQTPAQWAWVRKVELEARALKVGAFDRHHLRKSITPLLALASDPSKAGKALHLVRGLGIRVVVVQALPRSFVDGVAFYLDDGSPVIGLSLRYDRIDYFWFTLLHELAHILEDHVGAHLDIEGAEENADEVEANKLAQGWLFSDEDIEELVRRTNGALRGGAITSFAREKGRHPGVLVGQLQHRRLIGFQALRAQLVKVSGYLT